jgi:hypothetical protein
MKIRFLVVALLATVMLALVTGTALAEGHYCRHWYPDPYYGGYWLYLDCPGDEGDGRWVDWHANLPWFYYEHNDPYNEDIREPIYY